MQVTDGNGYIFGPNGLQINGSDGKPKVISGGGTSSIPFGTASGTDIYSVSITGFSSYNDGDAYLVRFTNGNTTVSTLDVNGLGPVPLYRNNDGELIGGDIEDGAEMLCVYNSSSNIFQVIGTSPNTLLAYVTNSESITITKGQPVYAFGGQGDRLKVKLAYNTTDATSAQTVGIVLSSSIGANQKGFIILNGQLDGLNILPTSTWTDGDPVYLGATAGSITNIKPHAPNHLVYLGFVTTASNGSAGRMYVRVQNGYEFDELHDVQILSPLNGDLIQYDQSTDLWKNKSLSGAGIQPTLVSATNIKTINGNSILGSGDLTVGGSGLTVGTTGITLGTIGRVLFEGTGNVLQQSANLFWDNTNNRLGIGTSSPNTAITVTTNNVPTVEIISTGTTASTDFSVLRLQTTAKTWNIGTGGTTTGLNAVFYIDSPTSTATPFKILSNGTTNLLNTTINNLTSVTNFIIDNSNTSGYSVLNIKNSGASGKTYQIAVGGNTASSGFANNLYFADSVSGTRMTIYSSGNLGIGTTTDAGYKLDVNGTSAYRNTMSVLPPVVSSAQTGWQIYRGASTSIIALSIGITSADDAIFNTANADYIFNRSNVERFRIGVSSITSNYLINPKVTIPTGTTINYGLNVSNAAGAERIRLGIDASENAVISLGNTSLRIRQTTSNFDFLFIDSTSGNVVIEKNASTLVSIASAKLALNSTTSGFLPPRMTNAQMLAIAAPAAGLVVYDTTNNKHCGYNGTAWQNFY